MIGLDRLPSGATAIVGDLADPDVLVHALGTVHAVVHTAALRAPQVGVVPDAEFERINVGGARLLAALAR